MTGPSTLLAQARSLLGSSSGVALDRATRAARAVELAELLVGLSRAYATAADRRRARMLARLMDDAPGQVLTATLSDRLFRSQDPARALDEVAALLRAHGVPRYMLPHERVALWGVQVLAPHAAPFLTRAVAARVRSEARALLRDADEGALRAYLRERHREGVRVNVNQLGEALLGEREAEQRVAAYEALAAEPSIDALSVKVSSVASQLNLLAFEQTTDTVAARLARILRASLGGRDGERTLVTLDMEAYAHVGLTLAALTRTLADPALDRARVGIVLQAYLPDSNVLLSRVQALAELRKRRGGAPLRVRLVKGANLAHERVECERAGTSLPVFPSKRDVDANYKRLLERALTPASTASLSVGVASHNLFDLAYALLLRAERGLGDAVELELLEGMAEPVRRALSALDVGVLVYAPICRDDALNNGIAYLVRRLDENTSPENYLRASFSMRRGSPSFALERERFLRAIERVDAVDETPRKSRDPSFDRNKPVRRRSEAGFRNEPDTDFTSAANRAWVRGALEHAASEAPRLLRSRIAGEPVEGGRTVDGFDPSRPGVVPYRVALADARAIEAAIDCAARDPDGFSHSSAEARAHMLVACAAALRAERAALIAALVLDGGKRVIEADAEVSEAIDFADYYRTTFMRLAREEDVTLTPRGTVLVTPPWNFPLAIAAGGVLAALMAGCRVLFKPALETPFVGERLARIFWEAGVPERALQLVLCEDEVASALVRDARVDAVILTGATATARLFQHMRPGLRLFAETGGKNPYIVSAMSDRELSIHDVVHSAFGHAGQKCSAASLLICEDEVYVDPRFRATLRDAVESLHIGSAWDAESFVTPLIRPPEGPLARALTTLEPGESWLVEPRIAPDNPRLVSPGVKLGVTAGSFTHRTELFGPVLGVMRARSVAHAIELANATGYGLTAGLASLDEREQRLFSDRLRAGNLYVNRTTTGAIVERQPFGGIGNSGFGAGAKAGGPNYVAQLCHVQPRRARLEPVSEPLPRALAGRYAAFAQALGRADAALLRARLADYARAYEAHFAREHEPRPILGQDNRFRYRPCEGLVLRIEADAAPVDIASSRIAAELIGARIEVSMAPEARVFQDAAILACPLRVESLSQLSGRLARVSRIRLLGAATEAHARLNAEHGVHIADAPVLALGRFELLHYVTEQSLSVEYHRYGNLGARALTLPPAPSPPEPAALLSSRPPPPVSARPSGPPPMAPPKLPSTPPRGSRS